MLDEEHQERTLTEGEPQRLARGDRDPLLDRLHAVALAITGHPSQAEQLAEDAALAALSPPWRPVGRRGGLVRGVRHLRRRVERLDGTGQPAPGYAPSVSTLAGLPDDERWAVVAVDAAGLSPAEAAWALRTRRRVLVRRLADGRATLARADRPGSVTLSEDGA